VWCWEQTLKIAFPKLFSITHFKDAFVGDHLLLASDSHHWNVSFIRVAQDWEVDFFTPFFNLLYSIKLRQSGEDKFCWAPFKRRLFDVSSFYNGLTTHESDLFPWMSIWWNKVPLTVVFFTWLAA
jgi:hypothetical protein